MMEGEAQVAFLSIFFYHSQKNPLTMKVFRIYSERYQQHFHFKGDGFTAMQTDLQDFGNDAEFIDLWRQDDTDIMILHAPYQRLLKTVHDILETADDQKDLSIMIRSYPQQELYITIRIGDVITDNSLEIGNLIKDVYIIQQMTLSRTGYRLNKPLMRRGTYNDLEIMNEFIHPHSSREGVMCLGNSEFSRAYFNRVIFRFDMFEYLMYLKAYLSWESLEGGPYRRTHEYYDNSIGVRPKVLSEGTIDSILKRIDPTGFRPRVDISSSSMEIRIEESAVREMFIAEGVPMASLHGKIPSTESLSDIPRHEVFSKHLLLKIRFRDVEIVPQSERFDPEVYREYLDSVFSYVPSIYIKQLEHRLQSELIATSPEFKYELI
jgi:hypothetical protein